MKIIMSRDLEATPIGGATSKPGHSCSNLTKSLVNDSSKFQTSILHRKVQVGKDQEKAQSEKDSHSKN